MLLLQAQSIKAYPYGNKKGDFGPPPPLPPSHPTLDFRFDVVFYKDCQ